MNYMIMFVKEDFDWCIYETTNHDKAYEYFNAIALPPEYEYLELRRTDEDVDTHISYEVLERRNW